MKLGQRIWNWLFKKFWPIVGLLFVIGATLSIPVWIAAIPAQDHAQQVLIAVGAGIGLGPAAIWMSLVGLFGLLSLVVAIWVVSWEEFNKW